MSNERFIPNTNPAWGLKLEDGDLNSLVDKYGTSHDDGYNFDEKDDEEDINYSDLTDKEFDEDAARKAIEEAENKLDGDDA